MLKGHAKIELTNVHTGEVEVVEHDNLITNAVPNLIGTCSSLGQGYTTLETEFLPLHEKAMGGILLFESPLEEDVNNTALPLPSENTIIGYASNDTSPGTDTKRGSRNLTESEELENGFKYVWDFATSEANGEISALALTHATTGHEPYLEFVSRLNDKLKNYNNNGEKDLNFREKVGYLACNLVEIDFDTNIGTCLQLKSANELLVRKYKIPISDIGINSVSFMPELTEEQTVNLANDVNAKSVWSDGGDGFYYAVYCPGKELSVARISKSDYTFDANYGIKTTVLNNYYSISMNLFGDNLDTTSSLPSNYKNILINNGYLYVFLTSSYVFNKLNLLNLDDKIEVTEKRLSYPYLNINGLPHADKYIINNDLTLIETANLYNASLYNSSDSWSIFCDKRGIIISFNIQDSYNALCLSYIRNYLATINNLPTPVTKTSAQSMKITYTITEES